MKQQSNQNRQANNALTLLATAVLAGKTEPIKPGKELFIGDPEDGDPDIDNLYAQYIGDIDGVDESGDVFDSANEAGDPDGAEEGGPFKKLRAKVKKRRLAKAVKLVNKNAGKHPVAKAKDDLKASRTMAGQINSGDAIQFITARNFKIQAVNQFDAYSAFKGRSLKYAFDKSELETPSVPIIIPTNTPAVEFATAVGNPAFRYYPCVVLKIGVSALNGIANSLVTVQVKLPMADGTVSIVDITGQLTGQFDATIVVYPHLSIQGKPVYAIGKVGGAAAGAAEIKATITGLPSSSSASILVPLSTHELFKEMQNRISL